MGTYDVQATIYHLDQHGFDTRRCRILMKGEWETHLQMADFSIYWMTGK